MRLDEVAPRDGVECAAHSAKDTGSLELRLPFAGGNELR